MLQAINISKSINNRAILSGIDLLIKPASITALIGPSGGGKSTLIRSLSLLEYPDSGRIILDDKHFEFPLKDKKITEVIHPGVTVVFQQFHLWPHLTVKDNIMMPISQQKKVVDILEYKKIISLFEIDNLLDRFPHQISVGQKQRTAFVRAVLLKPKYLLLDEITSALDIKHIGNVLKYIQYLAENGTGVIIATHLIGFAASASTQIIFLDDGKIVEQGDKNILKNPKSELFSKFLTYLEYEG